MKKDDKEGNDLLKEIGSNWLHKNFPSIAIATTLKRISPCICLWKKKYDEVTKEEGKNQLLCYIHEVKSLKKELPKFVGNISTAQRKIPQCSRDWITLKVICLLEEIVLCCCPSLKTRPSKECWNANARNPWNYACQSSSAIPTAFFCVVSETNVSFCVWRVNDDEYLFSHDDSPCRKNRSIDMEDCFATMSRRIWNEVRGSRCSFPLCHGFFENVHER